MPRVKKPAVNFPFSPLGTCPNALKKRWEKKAKKAHSSYKTAVELKCMECVAWDRREAVTCFVTSCPLYAFNRVIFNKGEPNATIKIDETQEQ